MATWSPTPVRNPTRTVREMKFARKPSRAMRASTSITAAINALMEASASHCCDPGCACTVPSETIPA
jgi:hypothetical protein